MEYQIKKGHLPLANEDSKMIVGRRSTIEGKNSSSSPGAKTTHRRDKTYQVYFFPTQEQAIFKLAKILSNEDDDFLSRLVEADRMEVENNNQRVNRYFAADESKLPGRTVREVNGTYLELHGNKSYRYDRAKTMCEIAEVEIKWGPSERHIEI